MMSKKKKERFEMLLEEIRDKVQTIAEGYDILNNKMDKIHANLDNKISKLDIKIDRVNISLGAKIEAVHDSLKNEIRVTGFALQDKLDEHARLAHAG